MLTLPPVLGSLAKLTAKPGNPRYAVEGVYLKATDDGWEVAATDTTRCVVVSGKMLDTPLDTPPALIGAPNGATHAILPVKWWADTFAAAKKARGDNAVKVVMSHSVATAACGTTASDTALVSGRFPPYQQFMLTRTDDLACVVRFDANRMIGVLKSLVDVSDPADLPVVSLEIRRPNGPKASDKPLMLRVDHPADGVSEAHALVMPAGPCDENGQGTEFFTTAGNVAVAPADSTDEAYEKLREENVALGNEASRYKTLAAEAAKVQANMRVEVAEWTTRATEQAATITRLQGEADAANALLTRFRDENEHADELIGLWGRVGDAERTTRDAVAENERLRAELEESRRQVEEARGHTVDLRAEVQRLRAVSSLAGGRRTLGQLAAAHTGGE